MKKVIYSIFAIAAFAACNKVEDPTEIEHGIPTETKGFVINVSTGTKATFNEESLAVTWDENEELHVFINNTPYTFTRVGETDSFECDTFFPEEGTSYNYEVLCPYNKNYGDRVFTYSGGVKIAMYGKASTEGTEEPAIEMEHLTNIIKTNIKNIGGETITIKSIKIESNLNIGGRYSITNGELTPVNPVNYTEMDSQNVSIAAGEMKPMFIQCKPFTTKDGDYLTITLTDNANKTYVINKEFTSAVNFEAGKVNTTTVEIPIVEPVTDAILLSGSAVSNEFTLEECLEEDGLFAYCGPLAAGELNITLKGIYEGTATPANPYSISEAADYRVIVNTNTGLVAVEAKSAKPNTVVKYNNTVAGINPFSQEVTTLWMYGGYNNFAHDAGLLDGFQSKYTLQQSAADPQVFVYRGDALPRIARNLKLQSSTESLVYLNFLVSNIQNNVWAYGSTAAASRNNYNGCVETSLATSYNCVGGQGNNRYAYFSVPEGANMVIVTIDKDDNTKATVKFLQK